MKSFQKRPIIIFTVYLVVIVLIAQLFDSEFSTDTAHITGTALTEVDNMYGFGRARDKSETFASNVYNATADEAVIPDDFKLVLQKDGQSLYYKEETAEIAFKNGEFGSVWLSNPADFRNEALVGGETRDALLSQITVGYYDSGGQKVYFDSYNACVKQGNFEYSIDREKLSVSYHISESGIEITDIPQQLTDKRFQEILSRLNADDADELQKYYQLHSLDGIDSERARQILIDQYKNIENDDIWSVDAVTERIVTNIYTILEKAGYTTEELERDNTENHISADVEEKAFFDITLVYSIEDGRLNVEFDAAEMRYASSFPPVEIRVLEFFGAAGEEDSGYILVPDGSGGLIHYNNGRSSATPFAAKVYGVDSSIMNEGNYQTAEQVLIPTFGMKTGNRAFVCLMRAGASLGTICANVSGQTYSYNRVYAAFDAVQSQSDRLSDTSNTEIILLEKNPYKGKFILEYSFLENSEADYSGMAKTVRQRLLETGELTEKAFTDNLPLDISYLGSVPVDKIILGFSTVSEKSMTSFKQAAEITNRLIDEGCVPSGIIYIGWFNGGVSQKAVSEINVEAVLGGKKEFLNLKELLSKQGIPLFGQVYFQTVYQTGNGFSKRADSPRRLNGDISADYHYDYMNRYRTGSLIYQISPNSLSVFTERFSEKALDLGLNGINISDLGKKLGSDFSSSESVNRPEAQEINTSVLKTLSEQFILKLSSPNMYAWGFADSITELPMEDSWFSIVNESVPFVQMILSGLVSYTCAPLNLAADYRTSLLEAIEYGSGLSYLLMYSDSAALKETQYNYYTTGKADNWLPIIAEDYKEANYKLAETVGKQIIAHTRLDQQLYKTDYENGVSVYVNYSEVPIEYQGIKVDAKDYSVVKY